MPLPSSPSPIQPSRVFRWRGRIGTLVFVPLALVAILSGRYWREGTSQDDLLDEIGLVFLFAGLGMRTWATLFIGGRKSRTLITQGPYSLCRNPLYLGTFLIGIAVALFLQSLTFGAVLLVAGPLLYLPVMREEERVLRQNHGSSYDEYRSSVPMFLPVRMHSTRPAAEVSVSMLGLRNHLRRSMLTLLLIPIGETVAHLQASGALPDLLRLP